MELVAIDLATFLVGISTVLIVRIPQVKSSPDARLDGTTIGNANWLNPDGELH